VIDDALTAFLQAHVRLDLALDGDDTHMIDKACNDFRAAIFEVRASGAWAERPDLVRSAAAILGRVEITQQRVKNLTRDVRERLAAVDAVRGSPTLSLYAKPHQTAR
jgi:hypothetical protein